MPINPNLKELITKCWSADPDERPTFDDIDSYLSDTKNNKYWLDDVDIDDVMDYIDVISNVDPLMSQRLDRIIDIKYKKQQLIKEKNNLVEQNKILNDNNANLISKRAEIIEENENYRNEIDYLTKKIEDDKKSYKKSIKDLKNAKIKLEETNTKLEESNTELKEIKEQHKANIQQLSNEIENLENENAFLKSQNQQQLKKIKKAKKQIKLFKDNSEKLTQKENEINESYKVLSYIDNLTETTIGEFNSYPFIFQYLLSEKIAKSPLTKSPNLFLNIINLFQHLLQFDQIAKSKMVIITDKNDALLKDFDEELCIKLQSDATDIITKNKLFENTEFNEIMMQFHRIIFEINYPSDSFDAIYNNVLDVKRSFDSNNIFIGIYISGFYGAENKFIDNKNISYVSIDPFVKSIGSFFNCSLLEQIKIPSSVNEIGDCSFKSCTSLKQITIPSSITKIGDNAFDECSSLMQIIIPSSVIDIGHNAFISCSKL